MPEASRLPAPSVVVSGLFLYPIKGCAAVSLPSATLDATGLRFDRRWMVVDAESGRFLTQRDLPQMVCLLPRADEDALTVSRDGQRPLTLPTLPDVALRRREVTVWRFTGEALDEGDEAAGWFSDVLGRSCRLVRTPDDFARRVAPKDAQDDNPVSFADGYPVLVASEASLADLNTHLPAPIPMDRFRANIVVSGASAWEEEAWTRLDAPHVGFHVAKPCARCSVTTVDQTTGAKTGAEPLATLARLRRNADGKVNFGMNLIADRWGAGITVSVGDRLQVSR